MATAVAETLLTAEEYAKLPDEGRPTELVRGRVVILNPPYPYHGYVCLQVGRIVGNFAEERGLGRALSNDSGVITERDPDTVRGADIAYYSYSRLPRGPFPRNTYLAVVPELIVEVRSPDDRWSRIHRKVGEYHDGGVNVVVVLDPPTTTAIVYRADQPPQTFAADDELVLPDVLGDFRVPLRRFFE
jgi:Uma2 family endonuclease